MSLRWSWLPFWERNLNVKNSKILLLNICLTVRTIQSVTSKYHIKYACQMLKLEK